MPENKQVNILPTETYFAIVKQMLEETGQASVRVTGVSMQPALRHLKDSVIISPPDRLRVGDIVLYDRRNGRYALHRIVCKRKNVFSMAGDNQWHIENNLSYDQVTGVVTQILRDGKCISCSKKTYRLYARFVSAWSVCRISARSAVRMLGTQVRRMGRSFQKGKGI